MILEFITWNCFMDIWFSTVLIAVAMFGFAIRYPDVEIIPAVARIGKKYSMIIYVTHIPLSRIMGRCLKPHMREVVYDQIAPFLIIIAALLAAKTADYIKGRYVCMKK